MTKRLLVRTLRQLSRDCGAGFACTAPPWKVQSTARNSAMKIFIRSFSVGGSSKGLLKVYLVLEPRMIFTEVAIKPGEKLLERFICEFLRLGQFPKPRVRYLKVLKQHGCVA